MRKTDLSFKICCCVLVLPVLALMGCAGENAGLNDRSAEMQVS